MFRTVFCVTILPLVTATSVSATSVSAAEGWGSMTGKIIWKGELPKPELLHRKGAAIKDATVCAVRDVYKSDLVVDEDSKGIANIFIYLPKSPKKIHPDLSKFDEQVVFNQENCTFKPHTLLVRAGQTVEVLNSDSMSHNTHTYPLRNTAQNLIITGNTAKGQGAAFPMPSREFLPIQVKCDLHNWMLAYWLILDHPYSAITQMDGSFEIKNLPAGTHTFRVWHERVGYLERKLSVVIQDGETTELTPMEYKIEQKE